MYIRGAKGSHLITCAALLCCLACGDQKFDAVTSTARDSAGITIVDNKAPMLAGDQAWEVDTTTVVRIGGARYPLVRVASAFRYVSSVCL